MSVHSQGIFQLPACSFCGDCGIRSRIGRRRLLKCDGDRLALFTLPPYRYGCACRKLNPGILVMQPAQDWATKNVAGAIDGAREGCSLLQG